MKRDKGIFYIGAHKKRGFSIEWKFETRFMFQLKFCT